MYCPYCFSSLQARTLICKNANCSLFEQSMPVKAPRLRAKLPADARVRLGALTADREIKCDACGLPCTAVCEACGKEILSAAGLRYCPVQWNQIPL